VSSRLGPINDPISLHKDPLIHCCFCLLSVVFLLFCCLLILSPMMMMMKFTILLLSSLLLTCSNAFVLVRPEIGAPSFSSLLQATASKSTPETFKKSEFIASIAEKTGLTKTDSEAALAAVLETITEVRQNE
jgi:hypothetical protein